MGDEVLCVGEKGKSIYGLLGSTVALLACQQGTARPEPAKDIGVTAIAVISGKQGESLGKVTLAQGPQGVLVSADLTGLPPGGHGFHIHGVGACSPDFSAAGRHFNPAEESHGFLYGIGQHAGDLPNIYAGLDGVARTDVFISNVTLAEGEQDSLFDSDGSAIIVHEKPDAYGEDVGSAGSRIACGIIQRN
ncbi:MAG: superoxide dismutase family protein [Chloroflexota bacterium]|nr:superoxide dismutase family protein [Chloroflexota bacterium]